MSLPFNGIYRFDEFEVHPSERRFLRQGEPLAVSPKAFEVLTYLVSNPGRVVTKEELLQAVWPDSFVEENNLTQQISFLRKALGSKSHYISTLPGRGYQFTAKVQAESPFPEAQAGDILVQRVHERTHMVIDEALPSRLPAQASRVSTRVWPYALAAAGVLALAIGAGWKWLRRAPAREYHKIVVADFINTTGDAAFDRTLKRALEIDLAQSPYLDVMSEREAVSTLQLMGRKEDDALTSEVAREVCVRSNRQVLLTGSIANLGSEYLLTLEAADCNSGRNIAGAKQQPAAKEKVLGALDAVADQVRSGLGESAKSLESYQVPILQATTSSLDALKSYSIGGYIDALGKDPTEALPLYQRAVELDPQFAMAYGAMATSYYNLNEFALAAKHYRKAFDLSGRVSAKERFNIEAHYYGESQKDLVQGIKTYQLWAATYPRDWIPWANVANEYTQLGQYTLAIQAGERALQLEPNRGVIYSVLARAYKRANRFAEAQSVELRAISQGKDSSGLHATMFEVAFAQQDQNALARELKWGENNSDDWYFIDRRAAAAATAGKVREAEELFHRSYDLAVHQNLIETGDSILVDQALAESDLGLPAVARATLNRIRKPDSKSDSDLSDIAILRAQWGDPSPAEHFLADHAEETLDTLMSNVWLPLVRATLAMQHQKPLDAVAALEPSTPYELADYAVPTLRGEAYLQAQRPQMAAEEFKKILANPGVDAISTRYPLAHLGLARAFALLSNPAESRNEYEKLFAAWKDADSDVPVLNQARREYAHLQ